MIAAYHRRLFDPRPSGPRPGRVRGAWEANGITLHRDDELVAQFADPPFATAFARIENHFFVNGGWFEPDDQLLRNVDRIRHIPAIIVQGRYDMCTPAVTAWELHRAWPEAEFHMIPDAGHAFGEPGIMTALLDATDRFADA